jgi:hypothetical protein
MSADNWTTCPMCAKKADDAWKAEQNRVRESYGKVSPEEYLAMVPVKQPIIGETFREDYGLGLRDGEFYVSYHGECTECGFAHTFQHREAIVPQNAKERPANVVQQPQAVHFVNAGNTGTAA